MGAGASGVGSFLALQSRGGLEFWGYGGLHIRLPTSVR